MTSMDSALSPQEPENSNTTNASNNSKRRPSNSMPTVMGQGGPAGDSSRMRTKHYSNTSSLSRDSSTVTATGAGDVTDSTGVYLLQEMLLNLELEMRKFVVDTSKLAYKFPKMSSYNRMLVHRVAAFFGLDHNIDQTGTVVVVNKTPNTRLPDVEFRSMIKNNLYTDRMLNNRRNVQSFDECRLSSFYSNLHPTALANIQQQHPQGPFPPANFGSATLESTVGVGGQPTNYPPLSSLDMIRRARSFEVGEWQNSMAVMGGAGGMAPGILPLSTSRHHRLSGGSANSTCSSINWQQQQPQFHSPGLEGLSMGYVAGPPYAAPPPQLLQQSSFSSSRPESLASLHSRVGRFGSGECVLDQTAGGYSQVRSRQVSSNSSNQPIASSPITSQLATLPISPTNHIKQSQDSGFEGGGGLRCSSEAVAPQSEEGSVPIDPSSQVFQQGPPPPTYPWPEGMVPPANYAMDMPYLSQYMTGPPPAPYGHYAYAGGAPALIQAMLPSPQYYVPGVGGAGMPMAAPSASFPAPYHQQQQMAASYGTEADQSCVQQLSEQYQHAMNISADSGTQCSPLNGQNYYNPPVLNNEAHGSATSFEKDSVNNQTPDSSAPPPTSTN
uniref:R3H domain-containing protein n=1 Tax=Ditylenchus dipsaci TaxID=166011 RepID=A0A915D0Q7_9BILA